METPESIKKSWTWANGRSQSTCPMPTCISLSIRGIANTFDLRHKTRCISSEHGVVTTHLPRSASHPLKELSMSFSCWVGYWTWPNQTWYPLPKFVFVSYGFNLRMGLVFVPSESQQYVRPHVCVRKVNGHEEAYLSRMLPYATHPVVSQRSLDSQQTSRSCNPSHQCFTSSSQVAASVRQPVEAMLPPSQDTRVEVYSDVSLQGWGALCGHQKAQGLGTQCGLTNT